MPIITENEIDEILYFARANEIQELKAFIPTLFPKYGTQPAWILSQAVDAETGNSALHYAGANGHVGMSSSSGEMVLGGGDIEANHAWDRHGEAYFESSSYADRTHDFCE